MDEKQPAVPECPGRTATGLPAGLPPHPARELSGPDVPGVPEGVRFLLRACGRTPAFVHDRRTQVLAASDSAAQLSPCFAPGTSLVRALFLDEEFRALFADDWEAVARDAVMGLASAVTGGDATAHRIVGQLGLRSADFRKAWSVHRLPGLPRTSGQVRLRHPLVGVLGLRYQRLLVPRTDDRPGAVLTVLHEAPGDGRLLSDLFAAA